MEIAVKRKHSLMQTEMQPLSPSLSGSEASSAVHAAYMSGLCAGLSFRSLLTHGFGDPPAEAQYIHNLPKSEHLFALNTAVSAEAPPFNFFLEEAKFPFHHHQQVPEFLIPLEPPPHYAAGADSTLPLNPQHETVSYEMPKQKPRRRRSDQKLSEKTRCLQKLLPWNKQRMDVATTLEEAYKYIKFLQAQISVLKAMPTTSVSGCGDLEMLNRQRLLQLVLNSPVAQTQLYTEGCCVYSMEQLVLLKRNALSHQMLLDANPNPIMF